MSKLLHITSVHDVTVDDRFLRRVTSPPLISRAFFFFFLGGGVIVVVEVVLLGNDGGFNQESRQFINPKEGACRTLTERTWF